MTNKMSKLENDQVYGTFTARIAQLIGRRFFNSIGEAGLSEILLECKPSSAHKILDIGSGNGQVALWFHQQSQAKILGIDPSNDQVLAARSLVESYGLEKKITFIKESFPPKKMKPELFCGILGIDSFCYLPDKDLLWRELEKWSQKGAWVAFSEPLTPEKKVTQPLRDYTQRFGFDTPPRFAKYKKTIEAHGFKLLRYEDRTAIFLAHWEWVNQQLEKKAELLISQTSQQAFSEYQKSAQTLLKAIQQGSVEYLFAIALSLASSL